MKTIKNPKRILTAAAAALMLTGLLIAGISNITSTAKAQETGKSFANEFSAERYFKCSNATLEGRFAVIGDGFVAAGPPPAPLVPFATTSLLTMDGAGNLSNKVTRSVNGQISRGIDPGTYTVNEDCTGTMTIATPNPPFQLTFDLVVSEMLGVEQGREFYFIATTPGGVVTTTAKKIQ